MTERRRIPSDSQRRALEALRDGGDAVRVWSGNAGHEWRWEIDGRVPLGLPKCIDYGWALPDGDRVTITPAGLDALGRVAYVAAKRDTPNERRRLPRAAHEPRNVVRSRDHIRTGAHGVSLARSAGR